MSGPERKSVEERQARLGRNEALFRVINERMSELNETFAAVTAGKFEIVCECGDSACVQQILIPRAEDARVRTDPSCSFSLLATRTQVWRPSSKTIGAPPTSLFGSTRTFPQTSPSKRLPTRKRSAPGMARTGLREESGAGR